MGFKLSDAADAPLKELLRGPLGRRKSREKGYEYGDNSSKQLRWPNPIRGLEMRVSAFLEQNSFLYWMFLFVEFVISDVHFVFCLEQ